MNFIASQQVDGCANEEREHVRAAVVAGDVGMEVLPLPLDAVVVGAVGRQEVESDAAARLREVLLDGSGRVNAVVVEDDMDAAGFGVLVLQAVEQLEEQSAVLLGRVDP